MTPGVQSLRVTPGLSLERALIEGVLAERQFRRVLDDGCGAGRLARTLQSLAEAYIGLDVDRSALSSFGAHESSGGPICLVQGNSHKLPFSDATFSACILIRVFHRLSDPAAALSEAYRVLEPGGILLIAVKPRPSLFTLKWDVSDGLGNRQKARTLTFSREERTEVPGGQLRGFVERLRTTRARLENAGFVVSSERRYGFEEIPVLSILPASLWIALARSVRRIPFPPTVLLLVTRPPGSR